MTDTQARFEARNTIESAGADCTAYGPGTLTFHVERDRFFDVVKAADSVGYSLTKDYCFPLGSDSAPEAYRHDGSFSGSRGYWRLVTFSLRPVAEVIG